MRKATFGRRQSFGLLAMLTCVVLLLAVSAPVQSQGPGGPAGLDIKIRAINLSIADTPFCGLGGGAVGDKFSVDAFMDMNAVVTGTAVFESASGVVTVIDVDRIFDFGAGLVIQNQASQNTIAIWMGDELPFFGSAPALVNVELPRGCETTASTFTPGVDKVTVEIRFR
jgi:hypothetical protein